MGGRKGEREKERKRERERESFRYTYTQCITTILHSFVHTPLGGRMPHKGGSHTSDVNNSPRGDQPWQTVDPAPNHQAVTLISAVAS